MTNFLVKLLWISQCATLILAQYSRDREYFGLFISQLNSYHHQVTGDVYVVNENTLLIKSFSYDGQGKDTFFWSGSSNRPGQKGFLVPDESGRTNVLKRYLNQDITLTLPEGKTVRELRWLSVYDLNSQTSFGDVYIPEGFQPPQPQWLTDLTRDGHGVSSGRVRIIDAKTIQVTDFSYDGLGGQVYFWVGEGPQPSSRGTKVPDADGYIDPLRSYYRENVVLSLPGELTIFQIRWLAVWNADEAVSYGRILIPDGLNIPPSLVQVIPIKEEQKYPNCEQLHKELQVRWSVHGTIITMQLAAQLEENEYVAFGFSGSDNSSRMVGGDVVVAYSSGHLAKTVDYNITAHAPCHKVLGKFKGVCADEQLGNINNFQFIANEQKNGVTFYEMRRDFDTRDVSDIVVNTDAPVYIIWAIGRLDQKELQQQQLPTFHRLYPKYDVSINFNRRPAEINCQDFTSKRHTDKSVITRAPWPKYTITSPPPTKLTAQLGPAGGARGYTSMTGGTTSGLVWYVNGFMAPKVYVKRGGQYRFAVEGGNDPASAEYYHPFIITDDPVGGYGQMSKEERQNVRVLAGADFTRRGLPQPTAAGRLCVWRHQADADRRRDDDFDDFRQYRNSLTMQCTEGAAAALDITPNYTWPPVVWYHSYSQPHMGWKLHVVDRLPSPQSSPHQPHSAAATAAVASSSAAAAGSWQPVTAVWLTLIMAVCC